MKITSMKTQNVSIHNQTESNADFTLPQSSGDLIDCLSYIMPLTTLGMMADFSSVGGIIVLATGCRIGGIKSFLVANLLPSLVIALPCSYLWSILFQ